MILRNYHSAEEVATVAGEAMRAAIRAPLLAALADVRDTAAHSSLLRLRRQLNLAAAAAGPGEPSTPSPYTRANVEIYYRKGDESQFRSTDPRAVDWIDKHGAELIDGISETLRDDIRDTMATAFEDQDKTVAEIADELNALLDDPNRADNIARTETMRASNEGQLEAWDQAVEDGLLTGEEQVEWITTPDDRLCDICEPMDGQTTGLGDTFDVDGEEMDGPPAHPRCRCTIGLVV
jgi:SPP1 gp7 family putative phage head morphogenesis protein